MTYNMNSGLSVTIDNRETFELIERKLRLLNNPAPLLLSIGRYMRALTLQIMRDRRADNAPVRGESWPKLSERTMMAKRAMQKRGLAVNANRPLVLSGKMVNSLKNDSAIKISRNGIAYGTDVKSEKGFPYPGFHQVGDDKVPARRWLFLTTTELRQILQMSIDYIHKNLKAFRSYVKE